MKTFKEITEKVYTSDYVLNKDGRKVHRKELIDKESGDDVKKKELDEALDPSEIAGNPKMYDAATAKKAYYHKNASASDKESLARHLDRHHGNKEWRKPVKEELDEESTEYEKSEENKRSADAAKKYGNMFDHHLHMADHHENLARWHASRGRHSEADKHSEKADAHHEKAMSLKEAKDKGEYDYEGEMAVTQLKTICRHAEALQAKMKPDTNLPEWVQSKITLATDYMQTAHDYLMSELEEEKDYHSVHVNGRHWKTFDSKSHAENVAKKVKGATVHKYDAERLQQNYAAKSAARNAARGKQWDESFKEEKEDSMLGFKDLVEKMNLAKANMGDVIKDFQKSDAPQFAGKSDEKKRQMAIAAKLEAERGVKEELKGNQHKIDKNKNGKVDAHDFKLLRKEEEEVDEKFDPLKHVKNPTPGEKKAAKDVKRSSYADRAAMLRSAQADGRLKEEEMEEQAPVAPSLMKHRISVTVSDPDHTMVSKRKEKIQKTVVVTHSDNKEGAQKVGEKFYKKKGYIVHDSHHAGMVKEEVEQIEEANHREFAQAGKMHPDMAKHMKTGQEIDFYHSKTGDKISGKVTKNDGKAVHIQANKGGKVGGGETHKFAVSKNLGGQMHEGVDMPMTYKEFMEAMWPGTPEYEKKFPKRVTGAGARHDIVDTGKGVRATRRFNDNDTAEAPKTQEKRGRGRPAGSKSGANQKVTTKSDESGGMTTHSLRLPSR